MPIWRLQCAIGADTGLARDQLVITPHFNDAGATTDPDSLCEDLADALAGYFPTPRQVVVKAYDAQGTVPVFPVGDAIRNTGLFPESTAPREVAVCLSFYSVRNRPRQRGRLYLPYCALGFTGATTARAAPSVRSKVGALAPILEDLGGPDVDWCVYSRRDDLARPVTNWWVDDEWDTIRSRGMRGVARLEGTTSEA